MNDQKLNEILKAYAYGATAEQVSDAEGISVEDAEKIKEENAAEIEEIRADLVKGGYAE